MVQAPRAKQTRKVRIRPDANGRCVGIRGNQHKPVGQQVDAASGFQKRVLFQHIHPAGIGGYEDIRRRTLLNLAGQHRRSSQRHDQIILGLRLRTPSRSLPWRWPCWPPQKTVTSSASTGGASRKPSTSAGTDDGKGSTFMSCALMDMFDKTYRRFRSTIKRYFPVGISRNKACNAWICAAPASAMAASIARYCARTARPVSVRYAPPPFAPPREDATSGSQKGRVHGFHQHPGALIAHRHAASGSGDGPGLLNPLQQLCLAGAKHNDIPKHNAAARKLGSGFAGCVLAGHRPPFHGHRVQRRAEARNRSARHSERRICVRRSRLRPSSSVPHWAICQSSSTREAVHNASGVSNRSMTAKAINSDPELATRS